MKVLFAVSDEISESIIKRYRKEYQEILTYKNVYFYNAILKEIQKNKDYDRIVISEELESFANNNNYDTIDKFIFEKLDSISDEANDSSGKETSIILICTDRRQKGNELLSKLFSIGIYNALLGEDRNLVEVCKLIKNPRTKKEAKSYYKIDSESSNYRVESENEVSEVEIQNILNHFKRLGKSTEKYASSFDTIAAQYTEEQLKIIVNCLPAKVKTVLSNTSEKYQKLVSNSFGLGVINKEQNDDKNKNGLNVNLLENASSKDKITKPIVIPSGIKKVKTKKTSESESSNTTNATSSIKVQRKPKSLQDQINRASIDERERLEALKKQREMQSENETLKHSKSKSTLQNNTNKDYLDEIDETEFKVKKNQEVENSFEDDDEIFGKTEKKQLNKVKSEVNDNKIIDDVDDDFTDLEEFNTSDDIFENEDIVSNIEDDEDIFGDTENLSDLENFYEEDDIFGEIEEPVKDKKIVSKTSPKVEKYEESDEDDDDIFGDVEDLPDLEDFDDEDDIFGEIEEPVKDKKIVSKTSPKVEKYEESDEDDDDIFGEEEDLPVLEDFDDEDDIFGEMEEPVKDKKIVSKTTPKVEMYEESDEDDDDIFGDVEDLPDLEDFDDEDDIFGEIEEPVKDKKTKSEIPSKVEKYEESDEDDDDIFGDVEDLPSLEDFDDEDDIFGEIEEPVKDKKTKSEIPSKVEKYEESDEDDDDIFGDVEDLPGLEELDDLDNEDAIRKSVENESDLNNIEEDEDIFGTDNISSNIDELDDVIEDNSNNKVESIKPKVDYSMSSLNKLLTKDKKIVNFIGTTKNGTSFLVNNLAKLFSSIGINTAILDMTKNRNSYYIFTNNDEALRKIAYTSFEKLEKGYAEGIRVDKNLTIYTALPNNEKKYNNAEAILSTLVQNHSLILVDCDFETDYSYFALCQELYLVQSMDILTMQPLTTFLRDLQVKQILESEKIRVVINKEIKVRDLTAKAIIGGMSYYKDPGMSVMVELFNKDMVQACSIPFEDNTYSKYLEAMVNCEISLSGYSKVFMAKLKNLGEMIYPLNSKPSYSSAPIMQNYNQGNRFSSNMNNTLSQMKKKY